MSTEENNQAVEDTTSTNQVAESNVVTLNKEEYDKMLTDLGSLKRENKQLKKPKETSEATKTETKTDTQDNFGLVEKTFLRAAGISKEDEVELAKETARKWDMSLDKLVDDEDFIAKLEKHRVAKANADATSNIKGDKGGGGGGEKSAEYWLAKGVYPDRDQASRKVRAEVRAAMLAKEKGTSDKFYNS